MIRETSLDAGWSILQDVHDLGETSEIFKPGWDPTKVFTLFSEWEPLAYLSHLQLQLSPQPYFGRELRYFNHAPWWYRHTLHVPADAGAHATLTFAGVDYYAKVWLNGEPLGEHEGYFAAFSFEVGHLLKRGADNLLIVKVSSPWDTEVLPGEEWRRLHRRICGMMKGTYEHDDTFIARDVNPIGIWDKVTLTWHDGLRLAGKMTLNPRMKPGDSNAELTAAMTVHCAAKETKSIARFTVVDAATGKTAASAEKPVTLHVGENRLEHSITIKSPQLWEMWEHGTPHLYDLRVELIAGGATLLAARDRFGLRSIELDRDNNRVQFNVNGRDVFIRGAAYFPEIYLSRMSRERYRRDVLAAREAGINALRVHVHVARPEFYEVCDELGMLVMQDSDFNWVHLVDAAWTARAVKVFTDMVLHLYNHPSIFCWICMNEPQDTPQRDFLHDAPGPQLVAAIQALDPGRPYIKGSCWEKDPESGDTHDYTGQFTDGNYEPFDVSRQRLNTEFGADAPPVRENLRAVPELYKRIKSLEPKLHELHYYQYRLLKYVMEQFRLAKYQPCAGYFQFMFIDLCPQSYYGVYDWWGVPKPGLQAMMESNQPVGVFLKLVDGGAQLWVVNDLHRDLGTQTLSWSVLDAQGSLLASGDCAATLAADSRQKVTEFPLATDSAKKYEVILHLHDASGKRTAWNRYDDLVRHPAHPAGHYDRMSHELGVRLWDA